LNLNDKVGIEKKNDSSKNHVNFEKTKIPNVNPTTTALAKDVPSFSQVVVGLCRDGGMPGRLRDFYVGADRIDFDW